MGVTDWISEQAGAVADGAGALYDGAAETVGGLYDGAAETVGGVIDSATETVGGLYDGAAETVGGVIDGAGELIDGAGDALRGVYDDASQMIGEGVDAVYEKVDEMTSESGLGSEVDEMVDKSPTLKQNMEDARAKGFNVRYGEKGKGTYLDPETKEIVIDPAEKGDPAGIAQSLAHETGHALYEQDAYVDMDGLSKEEYVKRNTMRHLKDEGEATITNIKVREEILAATRKADGSGGTDIGVAGSQGEQYKALYAKYPDPKDRDKLREEIGKVFAKGETPSTDKSSNYEDYYGETYKNHWDEKHAK